MNRKIRGYEYSLMFLLCITCEYSHRSVRLRSDLLARSTQISVTMIAEQSPHLLGLRILTEIFLRLSLGCCAHLLTNMK